MTYAQLKNFPQPYGSISRCVQVASILVLNHTVPSPSVTPNNGQWRNMSQDDAALFGSAVHARLNPCAAAIVLGTT